MRLRKAATGRNGAECEGRGRTALVTGASSGIGRSYATLLASKGFDVVVVARRAPLLEELKDELESQWDVKVYPVVVDLSDVEAPTKIVSFLEERGLSVDYLVNNAGYGLKGTFVSNEWDQHRDYLQVLTVAPIELTRRLASAMVERGWGRIVNIGSIAGTFAGTPKMVLYGSTKSMLTKFTEGLASELAPSGVSCTIVLPGYTDTEFFKVPAMSSDGGNNRGFMERTALDPNVVVRQAYDACEQGRRRLINGFATNALYQVVAQTQVVCPARLRYRLADFLSELIL